MLAATVMLLVNGLLVSGIVCVQQGRLGSQTFRQLQRHCGGLELGLFAVGLSMALASARSPWGLLLGVTPCLLAYQLLQHRRRPRPMWRLHQARGTR